LKPARVQWWSKHPDALKILLDAGGKSLTSAQFTSLVARAEMEGRNLVFLVGGADGLPEEWLTRADFLLSLSPMTYPHEIARVMLAEQLYRAFTSLRGHPYPR
jgi:23S rRNA (pseudouridine1915-N3)-methyltransferase